VGAGKLMNQKKFELDNKDMISHQNSAIIWYLKKYKKATVRDLMDFDYNGDDIWINDPRKRISELRRLGYNIKSNFIKTSFSRYVEYELLDKVA
jgi:hypothetical protein